MGVESETKASMRMRAIWPDRSLAKFRSVIPDFNRRFSVYG